MFTGLIEQIGKIERLEKRAGGDVLTVALQTPWPTPLAQGESVCVNGACLTVVRGAAGRFSCDVLAETLQRTNLGAKRAGAQVNIERAMRADARLGGHIVTGHVDGPGRLADRTRNGKDWILKITHDCVFAPEIVLKGSIAVDGVSLTVAECGDDWFVVHLIPHTWDNTALSALAEGEPVNLETDIIGKYVRRCLELRNRPKELTLQALRDAGFLLD